MNYKRDPLSMSSENQAEPQSLTYFSHLWASEPLYAQHPLSCHNCNAPQTGYDCPSIWGEWDSFVTNNIH